MKTYNEKKDKKKLLMMVIIWVLVLFLIGSVALPIIIYAGYTQKDIDKLEDQLDGLGGKKDQLEGAIQAGQTSAQTQMQKKISLENEIEKLSKDIFAANAKIGDLDYQIQQKESEIAVLTDQFNKEYELYKKRVKETYEEGTVSYLSVLLDADSFSDMLTRIDFVGMMIEQDKGTMDNLAISKQQLCDAKASIELSKIEQASLKESLVSEKATMDSKVSQCEAIISDIESDTAKKKAALEEAEKYEAEIQAEIKRILKEIAKQNIVYVGGNYTWPLPGHYKITSDFGYRYHPILHYNKLHTGVDVGAPKGTKIVAANSGTVITSAMSVAYGNYIMINHGGGQVTLYAHMSQRLVSKGDKVTKGDVIGKVGSTGYSTGNHLHFEIRINGEYVNPMTYFTKQ